MPLNIVLLEGDKSLYLAPQCLYLSRCCHSTHSEKNENNLRASLHTAWKNVAQFYPKSIQRSFYSKMLHLGLTKDVQI